MKHNRMLTPLIVLIVVLSTPLVFAAAPELQAQGDRAVQTGDYHQAVTFYRRALREDPQNTRIMLRIASAEEVIGNLAVAKKLVHKILVIDASDVQAYLLLGYLHSQQSDWVRARIAYQTAAVIAPDNAQAALGLSHAIETLGDAAGANDEMKRYKQLTTGKPE